MSTSLPKKMSVPERQSAIRRYPDSTDVAAHLAALFDSPTGDSREIFESVFSNPKSQLAARAQAAYGLALTGEVSGIDFISDLVLQKRNRSSDSLEADFRAVRGPLERLLEFDSIDRSSVEALHRAIERIESMSKSVGLTQVRHLTRLGYPLFARSRLEAFSKLQDLDCSYEEVSHDPCGGDLFERIENNYSFNSIRSMALKILGTRNPVADSTQEETRNPEIARVLMEILDGLERKWEAAREAEKIEALRKAEEAKREWKQKWEKRQADEAQRKADEAKFDAEQLARREAKERAYAEWALTSEGQAAIAEERLEAERDRQRRQKADKDMRTRYEKIRRSEAKLCVNCGKPLGFLQVAFGMARHRTCHSFSL